MDVSAEALNFLQAQWEGAAQWLYFDAIFHFMRDEIDVFRDNVLHEMMRWLGGVALAILMLWLIAYGYRIMQGKVHEPMLGVVDVSRIAFVVTLALTMTMGNSNVYEFLVSGLPGEIAQALTGKDQHPEDMVNESLAKMEVAMVAIDALNVHTNASENLETDADRAAWFAGVGTAGPALVGGMLLVMYRAALALFIGLAPLFLLCLLFKPTQALFQKWLLYGIGTMFGQATMAFWTVVAMKVVLSVSGVFIAQYAVAASTGLSPNSVTSMAMLQGGIGLFLTLLLVTVPAIAAAFFQGTLGSFLSHSVFGRSGGANRPKDGTSHDPTHQARSAEREVPPGQQFLHPQRTAAPGQDEIKRKSPPEGDSFLARYPHALASNNLIGGGQHDDITTLERVRVTAPRDERFSDVTSTVDSTSPSWMQPYDGPESINYAREMEERDPRIRTADLIGGLNNARLLTSADRDAVRQAYAALQTHSVRPIYDQNDPHSYLVVVTRDGTRNDSEKMVYDTNPAILTNDLLIEGNTVKRLYLRGVGTDGYTDSLAGGGTGYGSRKGVDDQLKQLRENMESILVRDPQAHISVLYMGFSRGAFAIRDLANHADRAGLPIDQSAMLVYDTVGSMGVPGNDANLGYDVHTRRDMQAIQLRANDEQREGFPFTSLYTGPDDHNPNWLEISLPGAHSDVGGNYLNDYSRIPLQFGHDYLQRLGVPLKPLGDFAPPSLDSPALLLHDSRYLPYSTPRDIYYAEPLPPPSPEWKGGSGSGKGL